jgi:polygalacturonase
LPSYGHPSGGLNSPYSGVRYCSLIHGDNLHNVTITGQGTINGQGPLWWARIHQLNYTRPHLVEIMRTTDLTITEVTLHNSPMWTVHFIYSKRVLITNIKIINPVPSPNTDGIDPDSSTDVIIANNYISTSYV